MLAVHETSLRVVIAQESVLRNAIEPNASPAKSQRSMACPFEEAITDGNLLEPVDVSNHIFRLSRNDSKRVVPCRFRF